MSSMPPPAPAGRRLKLAGVLALVLGALCVAIAAVPIVHTFSNTFVDELRSPVYTAPFARTVSLDRGKYLLLESEQSSAQVLPDAVEVIDADGSALGGVQQSGGNNTVNRDNERFVDVLEFTTGHAGRYRIEVVGPSDARLLVGRDPADAFTRVARWFEVGGAGLLLMVLGFVLLLVGSSRSRPASRAPVLVYYGQPQYAGGRPPYPGPYHGNQPAGPAAPPPGWYPDPAQTGGWRYWDGYHWRP
ncbi:MAG TPA: hypothetical protein VFU36_06920 [Jatrophihabitans sp.]|nr:hypothetical protein [Jatrophihabitans sp.]